MKVILFLLFQLVLASLALPVFAADLPTGSILVNADATYTDTRAVTLTFPGASSDIVQMELRNGTTGSFQNAVPFADPYSYTLPNTQGLRTVSVRFSDTAGNKSTGVISDSIILDSISPLISDATSSAVAVQNGDSINIAVTISDANQADIGISNIQADLSGLGDLIDANPNSYDSSTGIATWSNFVVSQDVNGVYEIIFSATDPAGNVANPVSLSITVSNPVETPVPSPTQAPIPEPTPIPTSEPTPTPIASPTPLATSSPDPTPEDTTPTPPPTGGPTALPADSSANTDFSPPNSTDPSGTLSTTPTSQIQRKNNEEVLGVTKAGEEPTSNMITDEVLSLERPGKSWEKQIAGLSVAILGGFLSFVSLRIKPL